MKFARFASAHLTPPAEAINEGSKQLEPRGEDFLFREKRKIKHNLFIETNEARKVIFLYIFPLYNRCFSHRPFIVVDDEVMI